MNQEEQLPEIDYLGLAVVYHQPRIKANTELVKFLMKRHVDRYWKSEVNWANKGFRRTLPAPRFIEYADDQKG